MAAATLIAIAILLVAHFLDANIVAVTSHVTATTLLAIAPLVAASVLEVAPILLAVLYHETAATVVTFLLPLG